MHMCVHGFIYLFTFYSHLCSFSFIFLFEYIVFFSQVIRVLSIDNLVAPPFKILWANCHVAKVTICPTSGVYCNACCSKSTIQKLNFFRGSIATMINLCYWLLKANGLKQLCIWQNLNSWIYFYQNKFNSFFQFIFMVNFACQPHLPLLAFKKTSNNLSHKQKPIWRAKFWLLLRQLFLLIMSNWMWNGTLILLIPNKFLNKNLIRH
jgi:hypothetical protein